MARPPPPRAWQRMLSGRRLDLLDPSPLDVEIGDVAHGLARVARWNGQTRGDHVFSVAQHSLLVERIGGMVERGSPESRLVFLLHDAPEYVVGDVIAPLKAVLGPEFKAVEERILEAVHLRFAIRPAAAAAARKTMKQADRAAAYMEAVRLAGFSPAEAERFFGPAAAIRKEFEPLLEPVPASTAEDWFLARFRELDEERADG